MKITGKKINIIELKYLHKKNVKPNNYPRIEVITERDGINKIQEACVGKSLSSLNVLHRHIFTGDKSGIKFHSGQVENGRSLKSWQMDFG